MGGLRTDPFQDGEGSEHWRLNYDNPVVQRMLADDEDDSDGLGVVGTPSDQLATEALFWRLVCTLRLSPREIDTWTLGEMRLASAFLQMQNDYKRIWTPYFDLKKEGTIADGSFGGI